MIKVKKILAIIGGIRNIIPLLCLYIDSELRKITFSDIKRADYQCTYSKSESYVFFNYLLIYDKCYRNIFYFRLKKKHIIAYYCSQIFLPMKKDMELWGDVAEGLRVFHGHGTVIVCNRAGKNLDIYQGVTVGKNDRQDSEKNSSGTPIIGNNVSIYTNAVVVGNITIGNNVKIGAGAIVTKSVPDNCTVVGNPMKIIEH